MNISKQGLAPHLTLLDLSSWYVIVGSTVSLKAYLGPTIGGTVIDNTYVNF